MNIEESRNLFTNILNENDDIDTESKTNTDICLITNEALESNYIKLDCLHCFNYIAIYNEVVYQKTKRLLDNRFLKANQIKCPYCRTITNNLLPYIKFYGVKSINGVTCENGLQLQGSRQCSYIYKKTMCKCNNLGCNTPFGVFCNKHIKYTIKDNEKIGKIDNEQYKSCKKLTIVQLKKILKQNKLKQIGNKEDLIFRILINNLDCSI